MGGDGGVLSFTSSFLFFSFCMSSPPIASVRRRNTLHEVGADNYYCHKRGLWGEILFLFYRNKIEIFIRKCENVKIILYRKNVEIPLKMEHITLEFRVF
jgi:hypothetical protein